MKRGAKPGAPNNGRDRQVAVGKARKARAIEMYLNNWDFDIIASELGVHRDTAVRYTQGVRIKRRAPRKLTEEELATALELLEGRAGYAETARTLDVPTRTLRILFPGHSLTPEESIERAHLGTKLKEIGDML